MKLVVSLDRDEDGIWIAECPSIPGCVSQGSTKEEALKNIKEAIRLCLEVRAANPTICSASVRATMKISDTI